MRRPLPLDDPRARHILDVLRRAPGDVLDVGIIDGPRGRAVVRRADAGLLHLEFTWGDVPPPPAPVTVIVGLPRPQTGRKLLEELTALGVAAMHFVATERGEAGYAQSRLWRDGEWRRHIIAGAQQAFSTHLPHVTYGETLHSIVAALPAAGSRLALDNYEAARDLGTVSPAPPIVLALGAERGWAPAERDALRAAGFELVHLGERVLRVETVAVAAVALLLAGLRRA